MEVWGQAAWEDGFLRGALLGFQTKERSGLWRGFRGVWKKEERAVRTGEWVEGTEAGGEYQPAGSLKIPEDRVAAVAQKREAAEEELSGTGLRPSRSRVVLGVEMGLPAAETLAPGLGWKQCCPDVGQDEKERPWTRVLILCLFLSRKKG